MKASPQLSQPHHAMVRPRFLALARQVLTLSAAGLAFVPSLAMAVPVFSAEANLGSHGGQDFTSNSPVSASHSFHSGFEATNFYSSNASASAEAGSLKASSRSTIQLTPAVTLGLGLIFNTADAVASFRLDDVVVSGGAAGASEVLTSLNLLLDGEFGTEVFALFGGGFSNEAQALMSTNLTVCIGGCTPANRFDGAFSIGSVADVDSSTNVDQGPFEFELLTGFAAAMAAGTPFGIVTPEFLAPVGTPFTILVELRTHTETTARNTILGSRRQADALALFDHTLSFPTSGAVFNLPDGFTAQSPAGLIVNNAWEGGDPDSVPVPEPSSFWLLAIGLASFLCARRPSRSMHKRR